MKAKTLYNAATVCIKECCSNAEKHDIKASQHLL